MSDTTLPTAEVLTQLMETVNVLKAHQDELIESLGYGRPSLTRSALQKDDLERWFTYHPPESQERKDAHNNINKASYEMAKLVMTYMPDEVYQLQFFQQIQHMRMMMNQTVTLMELDGIGIPELD